MHTRTHAPPIDRQNRPTDHRRAPHHAARTRLHAPVARPFSFLRGRARTFASMCWGGELAGCARASRTAHNTSRTSFGRAGAFMCSCSTRESWGARSEQPPL